MRAVDAVTAENSLKKNRRRRRFQSCAAILGGAGLSVAIRLIHYNQSLWCDEMGILLDYAHQPWHTVLAAGAGEYVPSNHFLHTILTKLILEVADSNGAWPLGSSRIAMLIRLPAMIAGCLIPLVLAWPFRHQGMLMATLVIALAAVNPFLVEASDEARGYSLMTLLGIIGTNVLPDENKRWPIVYGLTIAAMIYTVPVGGMLIVGHGLAILFLRRSAFWNWLRGALIGGVLTIGLFSPMASGLLFYMRHPQPAPDSFVNFVNQLPRFVFAGGPVPDDSGGALGRVIYWMIPVLILCVGTCLGLRQKLLRVPLAIMGFATMAFVIAAIFFPGAGQMRFVPWCALWLVMCASAIVLQIAQRLGKPGLLIASLVVAGWFVYRDIVLLPAQPIREAIAMADRLTPPGTKILVGFLAADDYVQIYGDAAQKHQLIATPGPSAFLKAEQQSRQVSGRSPWLIVSFDYIVKNTAPQFWNYIQANYELKARVPGRVSSVEIYGPS